MKSELRHVVERRPLFWSAVLALGAVLVADGAVLPGSLLVLFTSGLLLVAGRGKWLLGMLAVASLFGGRHDADVSRRADTRHWMGSGREVAATVRVTDEPEWRDVGGSRRFTMLIGR